MPLKISSDSALLTPPVLVPPPLESAPPPIADRVNDLPAVEELVKAPKNKASEKDPKKIEGTDGSIPLAFEVTEKTVGMTLTFSAMMRLVASAVGNFFKQAFQVHKITSEIARVFQGVNLLAIASTPFHLFHIGEGIYNFIVGKSDFGELVNHTLEMLLELTDSVISFLSGLAAVGAIPLKLLGYLWPFDLVGIALNIISLVNNARGWHASRGFANELGQLLKANGKGDAVELKNLDQIVAYINKKSVVDLGKALNADGEDIKNRVNFVYQKVMNAASDEDRDAAKQELSSAVRTLHHRVSTKIISHKLAITSASISVVANTTLFVSPFIAAAAPGFAAALPILVPLMQSLKAASAAISLSNSIYKLVNEQKFANSKFMKMEIPFVQKNVAIDKLAMT